MDVDDPDMKPLTGVFRQPNTANWSYQKKVPKDLAHHPAIKGKAWGFRGSLETANLREATPRRQPYWRSRASWAVLRAAMKTTSVAEVTRALQVAIASQVKARILAENDQLREAPRGAGQDAESVVARPGKGAQTEADKGVRRR